jgi:hypothetical protein
MKSRDVKILSIAYDVLIDEIPGVNESPVISHTTPARIVGTFELRV